MRFQVDQTLFAVHFGYIKNLPRTYAFFGMPMMWDEVEPDDINFVKLTVTEHHKVPNSYDPDRKLDYDGYVLKNEAGKQFVNQYPSASYGQTSDEGNRRFEVRTGLGETLDEMQEKDQKVIFEYHLLSDVLERIQRGINELHGTPETHERYNQCKVKHDALVKMYDRIVKEFHEKYPDYQLDMAWKPLMKTELLWPDVTIYKRVSLDIGEAMSKEDIVKDFNSDGCFEVVYSDGSLLCIQKKEGTYLIDGKMTDVNTIDVLYAEKSEEDDKIVFYVHQTEYFPRDWVEMAVESFIERLKDGGIKATGKGMSIDAVAAKDKELVEGTYQVRS